MFDTNLTTMTSYVQPVANGLHEAKSKVLCISIERSSL